MDTSGQVAKSEPKGTFEFYFYPKINQDHNIFELQNVFHEKKFGKSEKKSPGYDLPTPPPPQHIFKFQRFALTITLNTHDL
jgi:hypothetical protein